MKFKKKRPADFECRARNDVMKIFNFIQEVELVYHFGQAGKLQCSLTKKGALNLSFQYGEGYGVIMPQGLETNKCADNMWLR